MFLQKIINIFCVDQMCSFCCLRNRDGGCNVALEKNLMYNAGKTLRIMRTRSKKYGSRKYLKEEVDTVKQFFDYAE